MNVWKIPITIILIILLSGCNVDLFGNDRPEGISKEHYETFVESYEVYEKRVIKYKGKFLDENNELIKFDDGYGALTRGDIPITYREDRINIENGKPEKVKLTEKENQLHGDFLNIYVIKQLDYFGPSFKKQMLDNNPEYVDPIKAAIELERKIINTLELDKTPISLKIHPEEKTEDYNQKECNNEKNAKSTQEKHEELEMEEQRRKEEEKTKQMEQDLAEKEKEIEREEEREKAEQEEAQKKAEKEALESFNEEDKEYIKKEEAEQREREKRAEEAAKEARERFEKEKPKY